MMTPCTPFAAFEPLRLEPPRFDIRTTNRLLGEVSPRIARVVRAVLGGNHPEVDDATQQALLAFVQALHSFRGECEIAHFASRIAARTALVAARRNRTARDRRDDGVDPDSLVASADAQHEHAVGQRRRELLRDLLAKIAPEQAETIVLRVVLGWTLPEVAAATNAPLNTVRSRVRLAKNALRAAIDEDPRTAGELGRDGLLSEE